MHFRKKKEKKRQFAVIVLGVPLENAQLKVGSLDLKADLTRQ